MFTIGNVEVFERMLAEAYHEFGFAPEDEVPVVYASDFRIGYVRWLPGS